MPGLRANPLQGGQREAAGAGRPAPDPRGSAMPGGDGPCLLPQASPDRVSAPPRRAQRRTGGPRAALAALALLAGLLPPAAAAAADCVIILHGLARSARSMEPMAEALAAAGYEVHNIDYPSRDAAVAELAARTLPPAVQRCGAASTVHFVTHSMGGILLRHYLAGHRLERLGHTVMLAPPNHGSEVVDKLADLPGYRLWNGPAGLELGTGADAVPNRLGPFPGSLGIIAGDRSFNPLLSWLVPGPDDGKVAVARTRLEGMDDFIVLPHTHTFMMRAGPVIRQTLRYLSEGRFARPGQD